MDALMSRVWDAYWDGPGTTKEALERVVALVLAHASQQSAAQVEALDACETYFDNRSDVSDGDYGIPEPNEEMRLLDTVRSALASRQTKEQADV